MLVLEKVLVQVVGFVTGKWFVIGNSLIVLEFQAPPCFVAYPYIIGTIISIITSQNNR